MRTSRRASQGLPKEGHPKSSSKSVVESVNKDAKGATITYKDRAGKSQSIAAEKVLIAVGRRPLVDNIGLEKTKAKLERGFVEKACHVF